MRWIGGGARRGAGRWVVASCAVALAMGARSGEAQGIADFDYENLQARGFGLYTGYIWPTTVEPTMTVGARIDSGYLGPGVRILPGFTYWASNFRRSEVRSLEEKLEELIAREQEPGTPVPDVNLGTIRWSDLVLNLDGQVVWSLPIAGLTYLGGGVAAHILNGSGDSIEETFVEDLLDRVSIGVNLHGGGEALVTENLRFFGEARAEILENLQYLELRIGAAWIFRGLAPGERRLRLR